MKVFVFILLFSFTICDGEVETASEAQGKYLRLAEIFKLKKHLKIHPTALEELKLKEGVIRIWAYSATDNNRSYMLWMHDGAEIPKLIEFDGVRQRPLKTNRVVVPDWISHLFNSPIDLTERNNNLGATIEHSFIIERIENGQYHWAYRKIEFGKMSDYSKLLELLGDVSDNALDIGWTIDE